jgi:hypothetical protein
VTIKLHFEPNLVYQHAAIEAVCDLFRFRGQEPAVRSSPLPAMRLPYSKLGPDKGIFIRVGSTNRVADRRMVEELRRVVRNESFDELPMMNLNSETVDFRAVSECFEPES